MLRVRDGWPRPLLQGLGAAAALRRGGGRDGDARRGASRATSRRRWPSRPSAGWLLLPEFDDLIGWQPPLEVALRSSFAASPGCSGARWPHRTSCSPTAVSTGGSACSKSQLDPLLDDPGAVARLTPDEVTELRRLAPALKDALSPPRRAAASRRPLVHGDLHPGNVARIDGELAYFDWTDACIAHPLLRPPLAAVAADDETARPRCSTPISRVGRRRVTRAPARGRSAGRGRDAAAPRRLLPARSSPTSSRSARSELDATHQFLREALARMRAWPDRLGPARRRPPFVQY